MGGIKHFSSCNCSDKTYGGCDTEATKYEKQTKENLPQNPDPKNFSINELKAIGPFVIALIKYPDCKNYEGDKILVYKNKTLVDISKCDIIDPHFCENCNVSPVARFRPTAEGYDMAEQFCNSYCDRNDTNNSNWV